ncbi:hypothetical protein NP493_639g02021 [Ridgeia piscesae]|uniref:PDZ domain-containing protein n=1 Tax=Ridgeia piscesae TaxID=27915 RepID=A0AAD9KSQ7_RIDPI|nr:hypothetical protein NP493_639g02021 [Ridgeia piscesae]
MAGDRVTIGMIGGAPWGFRLYGGEADPLLVAKAYEAGLRENDILLGINGVACHGMNHSTAMGIVDSTGHSLNMLVLSDRVVAHGSVRPNT